LITSPKGSSWSSSVTGVEQNNGVQARKGKGIAGEAEEKEHHESRKLESGKDILDNNGVNLLMAGIMSVGGMVAASIYWGVPLGSIFA
jgi:hypothetical protein